MAKKAEMERWLIWQAMQAGNKQSAENAVISNRADMIQRFNQSKTDFTGALGFQGDYGENPVLGAFDPDLSADMMNQKKKKKNMLNLGAVI